MRVLVMAVLISTFLASLLIEGAEAAYRSPDPGSEEPVWVSEPIMDRNYGYWLGDKTEFVYLIKISPGFEVDLSMLPGVGEKVGKFVVRSKHVISEDKPGNRQIIVIRYIVQNFAVLCQQEYITFGPLEIFWKKSQESGWKRYMLSPAKILVSPISLCREFPDPKMIPKNLMSFSYTLLAEIIIAAGVLLIFAAFVIFGRAFLLEIRRMEDSVLYRALDTLKSENISLLAAIKEFRNAIRVKFGVTGSDDAFEVLCKIRNYKDSRGNALYQEFASEISLIWEKTLEILYEEKEIPELLENIKILIGKLALREAEEIF